GMHPSRRPPSPASSKSRPGTFAVAAVARTRLRRSRRNVVFPSPFGPTKPIARSGTLTVRSSTARTSPKPFVSPAVSTSTIVPSLLWPIRRGRCPRRCPSLDSSFAAPPPEERQQERDRHVYRDDEDDLSRTEARRRPGAERVRPEAHFRRGRAVLVGDALHIESDVVRPVRRLVAATRKTRGNDREIRERLIEFV